MHFATGCFRNDQLIILYIEKEGSLLALSCFLEQGQFSSQVGLGPSGRQSASQFWEPVNSCFVSTIFISFVILKTSALSGDPIL